ncbi:hypothetical protein ABZ851_14475 [Streptomyces sp. NPDC047049]|uniref:hypothetical protein n=1 Tax=Streptomyces sp. NPDC047049 TaxID=3156688 RepID=UPI0033C3664A
MSAASLVGELSLVTGPVMVLEVSEKVLDMGWLASGRAVAGHSGESSLELMC